MESDILIEVTPNFKERLRKHKKRTGTTQTKEGAVNLMRMFGRRFLIIPLGVLAASMAFWVYSDKGWAQPSSASSSSPRESFASEPPSEMPPIPDLPVPNETGGASSAEEEFDDLPQGMTAAEEILAPLEAGPTAEEEILAPLEGVEVAGDSLEGVGPQEYIVQEGDTLWEITNTYFTDSFLWPKVWKSNKTILDPDMIYPGNIILIPGELGRPFPPPGAPTAAAPVPRIPDAPRAAEPAEKGSPAEPSKQHRIEVVLPEVTSPQGTSLDLSTLPNPGYMVTKEDRLGKIVGARDGREVIGEGETVYLRPKRSLSPKIGDQFTVYRIMRKVEHPKTGRNIGKLLRILGTVEVTLSKPEEKTVTAKVLNSLDFMKHGDLLMPRVLKESATSVSFSTTPEAPLDGFILDVNEHRISQGEHDLVFLDRGRQHGLKIGNRLTIVREGERTPIVSPGRGVKLPSRTIGQLQVISVQDITATALILKSTEVIIRGDRFETPPQP